MSASSSSCSSSSSTSSIATQPIVMKVSTDGYIQIGEVSKNQKAVELASAIAKRSLPSRDEFLSHPLPGMIFGKYTKIGCTTSMGLFGGAAAGLASGPLIPIIMPITALAGAGVGFITGYYYACHCENSTYDEWAAIQQERTNFLMRQLVATATGSDPSYIGKYSGKLLTKPARMMCCKVVENFDVAAGYVEKTHQCFNCSANVTTADIEVHALTIGKMKKLSQILCEKLEKEHKTEDGRDKEIMLIGTRKLSAQFQSQTSEAFETTESFYKQQLVEKKITIRQFGELMAQMAKDLDPEVREVHSLNNDDRKE